MKKEIKERIEAVRRGEVPEGFYKDYCLMPNSWKTVELKKIAQKVSKKNKDGEDIVVLSNSAVRGVVLQCEYFEKDIANDENTDGYFVVEPRDYIYNPRISVRAPFGPINRNNLGHKGIVSPLYTVFRPKDYKTIDQKYLEYFFLSTRWNRFVYTVSNQGVRFDRMNITDDDFFRMPIVVPPLVEQQKIAEILATCDRAIELKQQLLEEKHRQKKWLMQKLLDPNSGVKLPGFESGKWRKIVIGEECEMFSGGTPKAGKDEYYTGGTIPFIRSGEIAENKTELFLTRDGYNSSSAKMVEVGDLLYALYGANSGECAISRINGAINQAILCVRPKHIERKVLYYLLCAKKERIIATYLQGGQGNLSAEIIKKLIVELPVDREHQSKIVEILHMADQEIVCCESELAEWQQKKKALMQLLLTGLVRVNA